MPTSNNLGFYGKLPSNGDFVSRNLPRAFIEPWDQWLQESIASSRQQLAEHWLNSYLTGPIWRFVLSSDVCNSQTWLGLVMPSVDRVGRYFPLTLAVPIDDAHELLAIADHEEEWFLQAEHIALSALDQNNNLEDFSHNIDNLGLPEYLNSPPDTPQDNNIKPASAQSNYWRIAMTDSTPVSTHLSAVMEQLLVARFPNVTLWWTSGSDLIEPSILLCNKLPPPQGFSALLTGNWELFGWDNKLIRKAAAFPDDDEHTTVALI